MTTKALIPTNGIHISQTQYPQGYLVAKYDREGFTSAPRWFPTLDKAHAYAREIA